MHIKELASQLSNRQYGDEITQEEERQAKINRFVVVFGYSDDCVEFRGFIHDELGAGFSYLDKNGLIEVCYEDCIHYQRALENAKTIEPIWNEDGYDWIYRTTIPHETFDILEDGEKYCRGIVFDIDNLGVR